MQTFTLSMGGKVNSGIANVKRDKVLEILRNLQKKGADYNYMILSSSDGEPVDGCNYIRVAFERGIYNVEVVSDGTKYVYKTNNIYEAENILEDFHIKNKSPDIKKWGWEEQNSIE